MLPRPFWLRLIPGGLGESHPAQLWQSVVDWHDSTFAWWSRGHAGVRSWGGDPPRHRGRRWARAVACVDVSTVAHGSDLLPHDPGHVLWSEGFSVAPHVDSSCSARPSEPSGWWLNWEVAFDVGDARTQEVRMGWEGWTGGAPYPVEEPGYRRVSTRIIQSGRTGSLLFRRVYTDAEGDRILTPLTVHRILLAVR